MICPNCGHEVPIEAEHCDACHFQLVGGADPEVALQTQVLSGADRQEEIATRIAELPASPAAKDSGLPESQVSQGLEDYLLELRRLLQRIGPVGRLAAFCHALVIVGAVSPWFHVSHQGYVPGLESWGGVPILISLAALAMLGWRYRPVPSHRVVPVLLHLALAVALVLFLLWRFRVTLDTPVYFRPNLAFGYYLSAGAALGATLGAFLGLKDVR